MLQVKDEIGSGTSFGVGALFQVKDDKVQYICKKYPDKAPLRIAQMIPIFKIIGEGISKNGRYITLICSRFKSVPIMCLQI